MVSEASWGKSGDFAKVRLSLESVHSHRKTYYKPE